VERRLPRRFEVQYDPYTQSINILDNVDKLRLITDRLNGEVGKLSSAIDKLTKVAAQPN
jgi:hypothetical protein